MMTGDAIDEIGVLVRDGGGFCLQRDAGGRYRLQLRRVPVDEVEKHVRIIGTYSGDGVIDVEGVQLIGPIRPRS